MANDDVKTRITNKAVKRKDVAEVETRIVKAVKRRADFDAFKDIARISIIKRGGLRNSSGEKNQGWVFEDALLDAPPIWLSLRGETVAGAMGRIFFEGVGAQFEILSARGVEGLLAIQDSMVIDSGAAQLLGPQGQLVATLDFSLGVRALDAQGKTMFTGKTQDNRVVLMHQYRALATIDTTDRGHDVTIEDAATPLQRFVICGVATYFSHREIERARHSEHRRDGRFDFNW